MMIVTWGSLRWSKLDSKAEWFAAWRGMDRAMWDLSAFIDFVAAVLPESLCPEAPALLRTFRERRDSRKAASRRGVILAGKDIDRYRAFFVGIGVPVYLCVKREQLEIPDDMFSAANQLRCSAEVAGDLSKSAFV